MSHPISIIPNGTNYVIWTQEMSTFLNADNYGVMLLVIYLNLSKEMT